VAVWHEYRIPILLSTFTALMIFRTVLHLRSPREKLLYTPPISPPLPAEKESLLSDKRVSEEKVPRRIVGGLKKKKSSEDTLQVGDRKIQVLVFFSSLTGTTEKKAKAFLEGLAKSTKNLEDSTTTFPDPQLLDLSYIDYDDYFITPPKTDTETQFFYLLLLPTYNIDTVLDNFLEHLQETHNDFRIDTAPLSPLLGYSVFGFGDREGWPTEEEGFCSQAREVDKWMAKLTGRKRAFPLGMGDSKTNAMQRLEEWKEGVEDVLGHIASTGGLGEGVVGSGDAVESDVEDLDEEDEVLFEEQKVAQRKTKIQKKDVLNDLEDIGSTLNKPMVDPSEPLEVDFTTYNRRKLGQHRQQLSKKWSPRTHQPTMPLPNKATRSSVLTPASKSAVGPNPLFGGEGPATSIRSTASPLTNVWRQHPPSPAPTNVSFAGATAPIPSAQPGAG
jgi:tRNA wybutosine-synthesizing protein 1